MPSTGIHRRYWTLAGDARNLLSTRASASAARGSGSNRTQRWNGTDRSDVPSGCVTIPQSEGGADDRTQISDSKRTLL